MQLGVSHQLVCQYIDSAASVVLRLYLYWQKNEKKGRGGVYRRSSASFNRRSIQQRSTVVEPGAALGAALGEWEANTASAAMT